MRIGNSAAHAASYAKDGLAQAKAATQKADPGPKASAQAAPAAVAQISSKGQAAAAKAASESQVEKANRDAAGANAARAAQAGNMLRAQMARATA
ncbi:MAG: hypothetical protein FJZ01_01550 [Candidatus Sericytochromatia bacterium]|nr:hypothetical protein [Candidatus Tanganyikabacteria bacterium]